jgi:GAF domain-containing protein
VALISLVGRHGQEFLGAAGLQGWLAETRGTPVEWSLCRRVVASGAPYVVEDAAASQEHRDNPLVQDGVVGSYVGVPLHHDGQVVGALCVISPTPRAVSADEVERLARSAARVERRLAAEDAP